MICNRTEMPASLLDTPPTVDRPIRIYAETYAEASIISPHSHVDQVQVLLTLQGVLRVTSDEKLWFVPPGKAVIVPVGLEHSIFTPVKARSRAVAVYPAALGPSAAKCRIINLNRLTAVLIETVANMPRDYDLGSPESRIIKVLLDQLILAPSEKFDLARPKDPRARGIADALVDAPDTNLTLGEWGKKFGASQRTLARLFEAETGMGFRDYRKQVQMHAAVGMLQSGMTINQVAGDLGYESTSAFIYAFRTVMGTTPGRYSR